MFALSCNHHLHLVSNTYIAPEGNPTLTERLPAVSMHVRVLDAHLRGVRSLATAFLA